MGEKQLDTGQNSRYHLVDTLRGICIVYMVFYHTLYDLCELFYVDLPFFYAGWFGVVRYCFAGLFMVIAGVSCHLSKNNKKRGFQVLGCAILITAVTALCMPSQIIVFGILHFMGVMMLIYAAGEKFFQKMRNPLWIGLFALLFYVTCTVGAGYVQLFTLRLQLPGWLYTQKWLFPLGITVRGFVSSDYYPLLPWMFCFFSGVVLGKWLVQKQLPQALYRTKANLLSAVGRYSLPIYMCHQVAIFAVLQLVFFFVKPV